MAVYYSVHNPHNSGTIAWNKGSLSVMKNICELKGVEYAEDNDFAYPYYIYIKDDMREMLELIKTAGIRVREDEQKVDKYREVKNK
jgi:hypothetical protein